MLPNVGGLWQALGVNTTALLSTISYDKFSIIHKLHKLYALIALIDNCYTLRCMHASCCLNQSSINSF